MTIGFVLIKAAPGYEHKVYNKLLKISEIILSFTSLILIFLSTPALMQISSAIAPLRLTFTASVLTTSALLSLRSIFSLSNLSLSIFMTVVHDPLLECLEYINS